jgi:hypothetical protein
MNILHIFKHLAFYLAQNQIEAFNSVKIMVFIAQKAVRINRKQFLQS